MGASFSIRKRLLLGLLSALFITWLAVLWLAYLATTHEVEEVYDAALAQYARVMATLMVHEAREQALVSADIAQVVAELGPERIAASPLLMKLIGEYIDNGRGSGNDYLKLDWTTSIGEHPYESKIAFLVRTQDGRVLLRSSAKAPLDEFADGFRMVGQNGSSWRVFGLSESVLGLRVMVGENIDVRSEIEASILANGLWPMLAAFPVMALFIWGVVSKGLRPLKVLTDTLRRRSPTSLEVIADTDTPQEVQPLVAALNQLFGRVSQALDDDGASPPMPPMNCVRRWRR